MIDGQASGPAGGSLTDRAVPALSGVEPRVVTRIETVASNNSLIMRGGPAFLAHLYDTVAAMFRSSVAWSLFAGAPVAGLVSPAHEDPFRTAARSRPAQRAELAVGREG